MKRTLFALLLAATTAFAQTHFPHPAWKDAPDPISSPYAVPGGTLVFGANNPPKSLNYTLDTNTHTALVFALMYQPLLSVDSITAEFVPGIANRWSISEDKRTFTFHIDPLAVWSDGQPITAHDVKWTFEQLKAPENITGPYKSMLQFFEADDVVIHDARTISFTANETHWLNFVYIRGFYILPKHIFSGMDYNDINFEFPVVSGPYRLESIDEGISITLKRRPDSWIFKLPSSRGLYNFDRIIFRYFKDQNNAFEAFKKGLIDAYPVYSARIWANETVGEAFDKNWIIKQSIKNHEPAKFQGFAMNTRKPPYDDVRVRKALFYLFDRQRAVRTLMYNAYMMYQSYMTDLYDRDHPCRNPLYTYDPEKAKALLTEAGYTLNTTTGKLEKDGKPLIINMLSRDASSAPYLALYKDALQRLGIELRITQKDFASWMRDMTDYNFEITVAAWGGTLFRNPEPMWHSKHKETPSGNNLTGYSTPEIDRLIEEQRVEFSIEKRNEINRKIDELLYEGTPYILNWGATSIRLLYWNKFGTPDTVLSKFDDYDAILTYWWYDASSAEELRQAMKSGDALPPSPGEIDFDQIILNRTKE